MKKLMCTAIVGVFGLAFQMNAFAASAQLISDAAELMGESSIATKFLGENKLPKGATTEQLQAAIGKLDASQQAAVVGAINAFAKRAARANGNATLRAQNEQVAKTVFTTSNGQILKVAAMATTAATRENVTNGSAAPNSCSKDLYVTKVASTAAGVSFAETQDAFNKGLVKQGVCAGADPFGDMNPEAKGNAIKIAEGVSNDPTCSSGGQITTDQSKLNECYVTATMTVLGIESRNAARANLAEIQKNCKFFQTAL